jgi:flavodoxin
VRFLKILITYFSNTGNTEKVAKSIQEGMTGHEVSLVPAKDVDPTSLDSYDLVILGSGIYASRVDKSILNLIKNASELPSLFAYFCTHASLEFYQKPFFKITKILAAQGIRVIGEFDCVGDNLGIPMETRMGMIEKLPDEKKKKAIEDMEKIKGRPNKEDLANAKSFGTSLVEKI